MGFKHFPLHPDLHRAIEALQFQEPTPVQREAIPPALEGKDILVSAQTGTGKTLAFLLPVLQRILNGTAAHPPAVPHPAQGAPSPRTDRGHFIPSPAVLVLLPTRELAAQVASVVKDLTRFAPVRSALLVGGENFARQTDALRARPALVLATPGRLLDHVENRTISFSAVHTLILDEADRMLDMGFAPALRRILSYLPAQRHTMLFSATLPKEISQLSHLALRNPIRITLAPPNRPADSVSQFVYPVPAHQKNDLLLAILRGASIRSVLIFCRTKRRADRLEHFLRAEDFSVVAMHSDRSQAQRNAALHGFKTGKFQIMVATDVAARGIDVKKLSHVINFDVPLHTEDYVHRIGRTGRHMEVGDALTLVAPEENGPMAAIERFIGRTLPRVQVPDFPYDARFSMAASLRSAPGQAPARTWSGGRRLSSRQIRPGRRHPWR